MNCCRQVEQASLEPGVLGQLSFWPSNFPLLLGTLHPHLSLTLSHSSVLVFPGLIPNVADSIQKPSLNTYYALGPGVWVPEVQISNGTHIPWSIHLPNPAVSISRALTHLLLSAIYRWGN